MISKNIKLSPEFKIQTIKAIASIVVFVLVYLLILTMAITVTALCVFGGILILKTEIPRIFAISMGIGLASLGFFVLFFLLKFLFTSNKVDRSHLVEITRADQPELFRIITQIVEDVGTRFPKKVYVSAQVNAFVFYDSSFWSMFFPVQKNLQIGMGLVNSLYKEELKAILAHEFGHFSQRTMKVGSYVYNVNQIIFNMLNDNEAYRKIIGAWGGVNMFFSMFVSIVVKIVEGIQWVLRLMYGLVNKSYLALSREMEFHADEIAANVTGYKPLKNALLRMHLANHSFTSVLSFYYVKIAENVISQNVFEEQRIMIDLLAKKENLMMGQRLPDVSLKEYKRFNASKLIIADQWRSHPSTEDRIKRLEDTGIVLQNETHTLANEIFDDITRLQQQLTYNIFAKIGYANTPNVYPVASFKAEFEQEFSKTTFPKVFNGYYYTKTPVLFDVDRIKIERVEATVSDLFSDAMVNLAYSAMALENDLKKIKKIAQNEIVVKTFDYDGKKYKQKDSDALLIELQEELMQAREKLKQNDIRIFHFFEHAERNIGIIGQLRNMYSALMAYVAVYHSQIELIEKLSEKLQFVTLVLPFDQIESNFEDIKTLESELKDGIRQMLNSRIYDAELPHEMRTNLKVYVSREFEYFAYESYFEQNLKLLFASIDNYKYVLSRVYFSHKKRLLDYKASILKKMEHQSLTV